MNMSSSYSRFSIETRSTDIYNSNVGDHDQPFVKQHCRLRHSNPTPDVKHNKMYSFIHNLNKNLSRNILILFIVILVLLIITIPLFYLYYVIPKKCSKRKACLINKCARRKACLIGHQWIVEEIVLPT